MKLLKPALIGMVGLAVSMNTLAASVVVGSDLQNVLHDITVDTDLNDSIDKSQSSIDVTADALKYSGKWEITGSGSSYSAGIVGLPGASFGVYDIFNPDEKVQLFTSSTSIDDEALLSIKENGSVKVNFSTVSGIDFASNRFGYYLETGNDIFFSENKLNPDELDHMVAFQGNDFDDIKIGGSYPGLWTDNEYVLAWDVDGDRDFADFVVIVESVQNVPEPGGLLLCAIGLLGYGFSQRKTGEV